MIKIKICGITNSFDAHMACQYGADALGFIFANSPRKVTPESVKQIIKHLAPFIAKVGVFVNADKDYVLSIIKKCQLDTLQLHGDENDKYCAFFQKYCKIIKAFRIKDSSSIRKIKNYTHIDAYLLDSFSSDIYGGTGKTFKLDLLKNVTFKRPVIIAGGISEKNCLKIAALVHPYAFDVSSSIESKPGKKDLSKMQNIIKQVKSI